MHVETSACMCPAHAAATYCVLCCSVLFCAVLCVSHPDTPQVMLARQRPRTRPYATHRVPLMMVITTSGRFREALLLLRMTSSTVVSGLQ